MLFPHHRPWLLPCLLLSTACFAPYASPLAEEAATDSDDEAGGSDSTLSDPTDESSTTVAIEEPWCGDGHVDPDEVCDDGVNDGSYGGCLSDCMSEAPHCGDGITQTEMEACDDGDELDGNGCNTNCVTSGTLLWTKHEDVVEGVADYGTSIAAGPDSSLVVAGNSLPHSAWMSRHDVDGNELWFRTFSTTSALASVNVVSTPNALFVGARLDSPSGGRHPVVFGYSTEGTLLWDASYLVDFGSLKATNFADGIVIVAGDNSNATWLRAYSGQGRVSWTSTLPVNLLNPEIQSHPDGGFVLAGRLTGSTWIRRYDPDQAELWTRVIDVSGIPGEIAVLEDQSIVLSVFGILGASSELISLDADGQHQWTIEGPEYESGGWSYVSTLARAPGGDFFAGGSIGTVEAASTALVARYSVTGELMWEQRIESPFDPTGNAATYDLDADAAGNVLVTGLASSDQQDQLWIAKFAP